MVVLQKIQNQRNIMETSRFFVANLPINTKDQDLRQLFEDYGEIEHIELKTKENLVDPDDIKKLAFVTLKINKNDAQYCANELNWQKINGASIKVSLAKESFLERLKREREEAEAAKNVPRLEDQLISDSKLITRASINNRKKFSEDVDLDDDDIAPELLIVKKRAATSMYKGKIVIQSYDTQPLHVIEPKKIERKLDEKSTTADQKRKESLKKFKDEYQQKKNAIRNALAGTDMTTGKKIKFSDAESDDENKVTAPKLPKSETNIFGSDDEHEENMDISIKPELFGKKGEKLMAMQSKQSLDPRFKVDSKFIDDDDADFDKDENEHLTNGQAVDKDEERNWQMGILEQVVGTKIDTTNQQQKKNQKKMLRYDPGKDEHRKFERKKKDQPEAGKNDETTEMQKSENSTGPKVSKEIFYVVKDTLAETLKTHSVGFSLLNMFGNSNDLEQREDQLKKVSNEKILINKPNTNQLNIFKDDASSDSEQDDNIDNPNEQVMEDDKTKLQFAKKGKGKTKVKVAVESFFIPKNDSRLKEGAKFFIFNRNPEAEQNYDEVRDRLKMLIKTKIAKTKKKTVGSGRKGKNKKFLK